MKRIRSSFSIVLFACVLLASPARAQVPPSWSGDFGVAGLGDTVFALGVHNGNLVAGGLGGLQGNGVILNAVGMLQGSTWVPLGSGVSGGSFADPLAVRAFVQHGNDLIVAGHFSSAGGVLGTTNIARWDGSKWHALGAGLTQTFGLGTVRAVEIFNNELYAGGSFNTSGGQPLSAIARWDGSQWQSVGGGVFAPFAPGLETVTALRSWAGKLYVGGNFGTAGGLGVTNLAAWDGVSWSDVGGGAGAPVPGSLVNALKVYQGQLIAGGNFQTAGGVVVNEIAAYDGVQWSPLGNPGLTSGGQPIVWALEVFGGSLYVGGMFGQAGGINSNHIARWNGSQWFGTGGVQGTSSTTRVMALVAHGTKLQAGGKFETVGPPGQKVASDGVAGYDGSAWSATGGGLGVDDDVRKILAWNGGIVAAGDFQAAGSLKVPGLAFFDGQGWSTIGELTGTIDDAVLWQGDLVVSGNTSSGTSHVSRWDGAQWQPLGTGGGKLLAVYQGQLYKTPNFGGPLRWTGTSWQVIGTSLFGSISSLHVHQGVLYIGGLFNQFSWDPPPGPNLAAWDGTSMSSVGGGLDNRVLAMTSLGPDLLVGGMFTQAGGVPAKHIARWDGNSWSQLGPGLIADVFSFGELNGTLYVGGQQFNQSPVNLSYLKRWTGSSFVSLSSGKDLDGPPFTLFGDDPRGQLWAGGVFSTAGGQLSKKIGVWQTLPAWTNLGNALAGTLGSAQLEGFGSLTPASALNFLLSGALPGSPLFFFIGGSQANLPFKGGTLVPAPDLLLPFTTDPAGGAVLQGVYPASGPANPQLFMHAWFADPGAPNGAAASNAISRIN